MPEILCLHSPRVYIHAKGISVHVSVCFRGSVKDFLRIGNILSNSSATRTIEPTIESLKLCATECAMLADNRDFKLYDVRSRTWLYLFFFFLFF